MNNAKRYLVPSSILERDHASFGEPVVLATDYAALEAKCEQQNDLLLYAHERFSEVIEERDALAAELEAARKQSPIGHVALGSHTGVVFYSHMPQLSDGAKLYALPPLAGQVGVPELPPFAQKVIQKLQRFYECAEDFESGGCDIGRPWFDCLTQLGLLERVQRSPALWQITEQGEALLATPSMEVKHDA